MRSTLSSLLSQPSFTRRGISWEDYASASINIVAAGAETFFKPTELRTGSAACFVPLGSEANIGSRGMSYCQSVCLGTLSKGSFCGNFFLHFEGSNGDEIERISRKIKDESNTQFFLRSIHSGRSILSNKISMDVKAKWFLDRLKVINLDDFDSIKRDCDDLDDAVAKELTRQIEGELFLLKELGRTVVSAATGIKYPLDALFKVSDVGDVESIALPKIAWEQIKQKDLTAEGYRSASTIESPRTKTRAASKEKLLTQSVALKNPK